MNERDCSCQKKRIKKQLLVFLLVVVILLVVVFVSYKPLGIRALEKATWDYIYSQGYTDDEIESVMIGHSYISGLLGYGQWITEVIFKDEPNISYNCIIRGGFPLCVTGLYAAGIRGDISEEYVYMHDTIQ